MAARWVAVVAITSLVVGACGGDDEASETSSSRASSPTPVGLATAELPQTESSLAAVFAGLPDEVNGATRRSGGGGLEAEYDDGSGLFAVLESGSEVAATVAAFGEEPGAIIESSNVDPAEGPVWLSGSFDDEGGAGVVHVAMWADPAGDWLFVVNATSVEMRLALIDAFVDSVQGTDFDETAKSSVESVRAGLPSDEVLAAALGVPELIVDVNGGPGAAYAPSLEGMDLDGVARGYLIMFRPPEVPHGTGMIEVTVFDDVATAEAVTGEALSRRAPDAEMVRTMFDVDDLLDSGQGYVLDPEPDSHFTRIDGRSGTTVLGVTIFHTADDNKIEQARALTEAVVSGLPNQD